MAEGGEDYEIDHSDEGWADAREDTDPTDTNQRPIPPDTDHNTATVSIIRVGDRINTSSDERDVDESIISKRKGVLKEWKGIDIDKNAGEASKELLLQSSISRNKKDIPDGGMMYKGVKVLVRESGITRLSKNRTEKNRRIINEFDELSKRAIAENLRRTRGDPTTSQEVGDDITSRINSVINDRIEERKKELIEQAEKLSLPEQEIREISGVVNPKGTDEVMIESLERQIKHYRLEALNRTDPFEKQWYNDAKKLTELVVDSIRISNGERPKYEEAMSILGNEVENNDLNRLERFKKWARENMVGLSAIAITIAGIITTIVVAARGAVSGGARAVGGFAKALANLGKSLGPLLAPLFSVIAQVLTWGAKGIAWLANNLWVLAIAMTWLLYDYWKNRK